MWRSTEGIVYIYVYIIHMCIYKRYTYTSWYIYVWLPFSRNKVFQQQHKHGNVPTEATFQGFKLRFKQPRPRKLWNPHLNSLQNDEGKPSWKRGVCFQDCPMIPFPCGRIEDFATNVGISLDLRHIRLHIRPQKGTCLPTLHGSVATKNGVLTHPLGLRHPK